MAKSGARSVGHPIDVATGVVTTDATDLALPSRCGLRLVRHYSTAMPAWPGALFGPGWRCEYEITLRRDLDGYTLVTAEGDAVTFDEADRDAGEAFLIENRAAFHELRRTDGWFVATRWDDGDVAARYWFRDADDVAALGVARIEDAPGQFRLVERDAAGWVTAVRESHGHRELHWSYGAQGRVTSIALVAGAQRKTLVTYEYDDAGRLVAAHDVVGVPSTYAYDAAGRLVREHARDGGRFEFAYDAQGRCVHTTALDGYDQQRLTYFAEGRKTLVEDARGNTWVYEWRADGQVERVISPLGNVEATTYDDHGRIASRLDGEKHETRYAYDARGMRCRVEHPDGTREVFAFDDTRRLVSHEDRCGAVWRWEYDAAGRLLAEVDPLGHRWLSEYNARGDLVVVQRPGGGVVRVTRDLAGDVVEQVDEVERVTRLERDARGLPRRLHLPDGTVFAYGYDVAGNLREVVTPEGYRTVYRYGPCRRLLRVEQPDGSVVRLAWSNVPGQLAALNNEAGEAYSFEYDADGRLTREVDFAGFGRGYEYDRAGRGVRVVADDGSVTTMERDGAGRVVRQRLSDGEERTYAYDGEGRLVRATNASADVVLVRDALGRVVREQQGDFVVERRYDAAGQRTGYRTRDGLDVAYELDAEGQLRRLTVDDASGRPAWVGACGNTLRASLHEHHTGRPGDATPWRASSRASTPASNAALWATSGSAPREVEERGERVGGVGRVAHHRVGDPVDAAGRQGLTATSTAPPHAAPFTLRRVLV